MSPAKSRKPTERPAARKAKNRGDGWILEEGKEKRASRYAK